MTAFVRTQKQSLQVFDSVGWSTEKAWGLWKFCSKNSSFLSATVIDSDDVGRSETKKKALGGGGGGGTGRIWILIFQKLV